MSGDTADTSVRATSRAHVFSSASMNMPLTSGVLSLGSAGLTARATAPKGTALSLISSKFYDTVELQSRLSLIHIPAGAMVNVTTPLKDPLFQY